MNQPRFAEPAATAAAAGRASRVCWPPADRKSHTQQNTGNHKAETLVGCRNERDVYAAMTYIIHA